jgi:hypothetical protein
MRRFDWYLLGVSIGWMSLAVGMGFLVYAGG